jgi:ferric-dicitrate binding protein FerR (iron transport regulator)
MSEREKRTPDERAVQERVRALPTAAPSVEFRARLRDEFISGTIPERRSTRRRARTLPFAEVGIALAAAAVLVGLFLKINRGPAWQFVAASGDGRVHVGERGFAASEASSTLPGLLRPGVSIHLEGETQLDLLSPGTLAIQMAPGSNLTIPAPPGRWLGRSTTGRVDGGEVRFVTGPGFAGAHLTIEAPSARIHATGTTFAVISSPDSTCVCVLEGEVSMEGDDGSSEIVEAGMRRTIFAHRDEVLDEEIFPMERMKLEMLRQQTKSGLESIP